MRRKGFTLVEIMIVVAIIALLAAIAIPNLLRARVTANESSAQSALKTLATAEISFRTGNPSYGTLVELSGATPQYIDNQLGIGTKSGYTFSVSPAQDSFCAAASPSTLTTGNLIFCITEDGVVRTGNYTTDHDTCTGYEPTPP